MLKLIELFAGIGSQHQALKNLNIEHEVTAISEIDKYALKSYEALHGTPNNLGNICEIKRLPKADLWTYSFPCQDISVAGNLAGIKEGTRSGLLYEVERLLEVANENDELPKYLLLENVKNLVSKRFKPDFDKWLEFLKLLGYTNYWKVLNAKDYGIPQNRERVFCVSIRGEHDPFSFPDKQELKLKLKDMLEDEVDEKYYLSQKMVDCFMSDGTGGYPRKERFLQNINRENKDVGNAVTTLAGSRPTDNFVIDDKLFLSDKMINYIASDNEKYTGNNDKSLVNKTIASTINTKEGTRRCDASNYIAYGMPENTDLKKVVFGNKRLDETLEKNDVKDGDFIDAFNKQVKSEISGTITTRVSGANCTFVAKQNEALCDELINDDKVNEGDVVNHSRPNNPVVSKDGVTPTITTRCDELGAVVELKRGYSVEVKAEKNDSENIDVIGNYSKSNYNQTPIVGKNGIAPTVTENHGQVTAIAIKNNTKQGYLLAEEGDAVDISGRMQYHRGTVQKGKTQTITTAGGDNIGVVVKSSYSDLEKQLFTEEGNVKRYINSTIVDEFKEGQMASTSYANGYGRGKRTHDESISLTTTERPSVKNNLRIRKLTSRECLRLMGWKDEQIDKIQASGVSNSQQYKQAGNGIVVNVLEAIFKELFKDVINCD